MLTRSGILGGAGNPLYLPSATISDVAVKGSASAYIDIGNMSLPAGDWCIGFTAAVAATATTDWFLLSLGTQSDTILSDNGSLTIGWPGASGAVTGSWGWAGVGKDDAGVALAPRGPTLFASSVQNGVTAPAQYASGTPDAVTRTIFVQKSAGKVSMWIVDPNTTAKKYNEQTTTFGAIASKATRLGCLGKLALSGFTAITYQRFFKTAQALTQYQMEAIASGVDPRAVATFSAASGDLLFAFDVAAADGQAYTDLIQGQAATAHGTFAVASALLPTSVDQNQIRIDIDRYRVVQSNGGTTDILFNGTAYGAVGDIQLALVNSGNTTVVAPYATVGRPSAGRFSGTLTGVTTRLADYRVQGKKLIGGAQVGSEYLASSNIFSTGIVATRLGQSLMVQMRTVGSNAVSGKLSNNGRVYSPSFSAGEYNNHPQGWAKKTAPGYGEGYLEQVVGAGLGFTVGLLNDAISGTAITEWTGDTNGIMTNALNSIARFRPKYVVWHQGENSLGSSYATYQDQLTSLYSILSAAITWPWYFLVVPVDNSFGGTAEKPAQYSTIRSATIDWADAMHATDSKVVLAYTVAEILKADTNADGIHKIASVGGYGKYAEREAQTILFLEGIAANSGLGPRLVSAAWDAATVVDVALVHNGGTDIQTPNVADITGFEASINGFTSNLTISSCARLDATHVRITLSATPGSAPAIRYQYGLPGTGNSDAANGLSNPLYDNRVPAINTTLGYPVVPTTTPIQSV